MSKLGKALEVLAMPMRDCNPSNDDLDLIHDVLKKVVEMMRDTLVGSVVSGDEDETVNTCLGRLLFVARTHPNDVKALLKEAEHFETTLLKTKKDQTLRHQFSEREDLIGRLFKAANFTK